MAEEITEQPQNTLIQLLLRILPYVLVAVFVAGVVVYLAKNRPEILGLSKNADQAQAEIDSLVNEVGKLIALPSDEKPTVATVTDVEKVKEQAFFKNAQNGDKVLIYTNAKKAILYRPSEKRIIEVGAVNIREQQEETSEESPEPSPSPSPES